MPDPKVIAEQWGRVADHLVAATAAWLDVDPDMDPRLSELARDALWNNRYWSLRAGGYCERHAREATREALG